MWTKVDLPTTDGARTTNSGIREEGAPESDAGLVEYSQQRNT